MVGDPQLVPKSKEISEDSHGIDVDLSKLAISDPAEGGEKYRVSVQSDRDYIREESDLTQVSSELNDALSTLQQAFVVSDATKPDYPIIYASAGFLSMTGYSSMEVVGRNCRFLQGPDTDRDEVAKIREAVKLEKTYCGRLLNYKKDGSAFWNLLTIIPINDSTERVIKFIGMQVEVSKHTEGAIEKSLRPNSLPVSLIRYDYRQKENALSSITEVVQTVKHPCPHTQGETEESTTNLDEQENLTSYFSRDSVDIEYLRAPSRKRPLGTKSAPSVMSGSTDCSKATRKSTRSSFLGSARASLSGFKGRASKLTEKRLPPIVIEDLMTRDVQEVERSDHIEKERSPRQGLDLATTLERIGKCFVITDPRLPDNPIIFASDSFLELTEYAREDVLGRNCRFLQGEDTDPGSISRIRNAIEEKKEITLLIVNYTKKGRKFWNLLHLQPMNDRKGELQYFIGVQVDGSDHVVPHGNRLSEKTEIESSKLAKATAEDVDEAVRELPDANLTPEDLWATHSKHVSPRPHKKDNASWAAIQKILIDEVCIGLEHFGLIKPLGHGDTGSVHLVELQGTGELFAMKEMDKSLMLNRNKVHRAWIEREILSLLDHPLLPSLYASFQTTTHVYLVTDFCPGGDLFALLEKQPSKIFKEEAARFYAAEVAVVLEYLHCLGIIYRDLKPENVLLQKDGHVLLTDFDLSLLTSCKPQVLRQALPKHRKKAKGIQPPTFVAEPQTPSNSFVGTEEYIAPEIISGSSHNSSIDWWALGILLYEMLYGHTPFRGKNRKRTFTNILYKDLTFPSSIPVSLAARQLIHGLLQRDPANRLGSIAGANDIKKHSFFHGINWALIRCMRPPQLDVPFQLALGNPCLDD